MRSILALLMIAGGATAASAQIGAQPSVQLPPPLERVLRDYEREWKAGRADSVAALFGVDGFALPSGRMPAKGRAAIATTYRGPGGDLRLRAIAFATGDSVGYIIGGYRYGDTAGDVGKFVLALRLGADKRWMIAADMDNANARPGAPPQP